MDQQYNSVFTERERAAKRAQREAVRRKKRRARRLKLLLRLIPAMAISCAAIALLVSWKHHDKPALESDPEPLPAVQEVFMPEPALSEPDPIYAAEATPSTVQLRDTLDSSYAIVVDVSDGTILAEKDARAVISPASMTKVLTLLVAVENLTEAALDDTFTMPIEITDYCFVNDCSVVGMEVGESATIRELLYGCILPSGADASLALANYVAGSHEAFVDLMNEKLAELGLSETAHFTNCVGLYDENHTCTIYDMAMIMKAAMDEPLCREVLNTRIYKTAPTPEHPEGQDLSNWFLRRIEDRFTGEFQIVGGKTGYVVEAGSCAVSCGQAEDGSLYICATGDASSSWRAIYDHTDLYRTYCE